MCMQAAAAEVTTTSSLLRLRQVIRSFVFHLNIENICGRCYGFSFYQSRDHGNDGEGCQGSSYGTDEEGQGLDALRVCPADHSPGHVFRAEAHVEPTSWTSISCGLLQNSWHSAASLGCTQQSEEGTNFVVAGMKIRYT
jgi:hypothetical protein